MIKNIILDVGGILFDDSKSNTEKVLGKNCDLIYKKAYTGDFKKCLVGEETIQKHIDNLKNEQEYADLCYILKKDNLKEVYPFLKGNFNYIKKLKQRHYKIYLLTNITKESYEYIDSIMNIENTFDGGIYSYQEKIMKPNLEIYNLIMNRFKLDKDETIFFDDKERNVLAAQNAGIKSIVFNSIDDIENNLL